VEKQAKTAGIKVIDYDRINNGGSADYYVSYSNVGVGKLQGQGQGLVKCLNQKGVKHCADHRDGRRHGYRLQRRPVQAGLKLGPGPAVQGWQAEEGVGDGGEGLGPHLRQHRLPAGADQQRRQG
jgi:ABC-type sugar transport system substrate-binding protein